MQIQVNGIDLWFDVEGAALVAEGGAMRERPVILALHGVALDHAYLKPGLSALADTAQVIYLDQRGQGRSGPVPVESCTVERMAEDAAAFCRAVGLRRPWVLGHCSGGLVALALALAHPGLAAGLILVSSAARFAIADSLDVLEHRHGRKARAAAEVIYSGNLTGDALAEFASHALPTYVHSKTAAAIEGFARSRFVPEIAAWLFAGPLFHYDFRPRLCEIKAPVLMATGDYDWLIPPAQAKETAAGIQGAELALIPECGHLPFNERPEVFADIVSQFLRRH